MKNLFYEKLVLLINIPLLTAGIWVAAIRPINMGETVVLNGQTGKVKSVGLISTNLLKTGDFRIVKNLSLLLSYMLSM